ncbi:hypothetical protein [Sinomonas albida]|uniref:hypothetical protein n=1 Tax=Sinomonas albida TaxID=369942 RepID=UPI003017A920
MKLLRDVDRRWVELVASTAAPWCTPAPPRATSPDSAVGRIPHRQADALERPLREAIEELGLPAIGDEAIFLWNILFDPREILDVVNTVGLSEKDAAARFHES